MRARRCLLAAALLALLVPALPAAAGDKPDDKKQDKKQDRKLDPQKALKKAAKLVKESQMLFSTILDHKDEAKAKKQTLRYECVLEQEAEGKGLVRIAEDALAAMKTAAANNELDAVNHELVKIEVAQEKIMKISATADLCGDDIRNYDGPTILEVREPPEDEKK